MLDKKILGLRMKELRHLRKLTLQQVGDVIGSSKSVMSNIEIGKKGASIDTLIAIADYFDVSIDYLVGRSDVPHIAKEESK